MAAAFAWTVRAEQSLTPLTIVVFNSNIRESEELAQFYAQKRGIARDHVVGLACSRDEEISREEYDRTIANPLRQIFSQRNWWSLRESEDGQSSVTASSIRIVALIRGMPLKISAAANYPGDKTQSPPIGVRNEASVDSELAVLGVFTREISGARTNPYFQSYRSISESGDPSLLLVCRLDAPTAATVRQMIDEALRAERDGLWGRAYVDGAHNTSAGFATGDRWLTETLPQFHKAGVPVVFDDSPATLAEGFPVSDCAIYYGWYTGDVNGPFTQPGFRFAPGAIAAHIHSFSANTLRNPNANWVAPLLSKGAAASVGNVYEPYLQLTTHLDIMNDRLLHGFSFAESAYMATPALSWMTVMVGDPLYRPYAVWLQLDTKTEGTKAPNEWKMYHDFAVQNAAKSPPEFRTAARQFASRAKNGPMIEDLGMMEVRDGNFAAATGYFQQARAIYTKRDDILRVVLEETDAWRKQDKPKRALELVRSVLKIVPDSPTAALLKKTEQELSATPLLPSTVP